MKSTRYYLAIAFAPGFAISLVFASLLLLSGNSGRRDWIGAAAIVSIVTGFGSVATMPIAAAAMRNDFDK